MTTARRTHPRPSGHAAGATPLGLLAHQCDQGGVHSFLFTVAGVKPGHSPLFRLDVSPNAGVVMGVDFPAILDSRNALIMESVVDLERARVLALGSITGTKGFWWNLLGEKDSLTEAEEFAFVNAVKSEPDKWPALARVVRGVDRWDVHRCILTPPIPGSWNILPTPELLFHMRNCIITASAKELKTMLPTELAAVCRTMEAARNTLIDFIVERVEQKALYGSLSPF